MWIGSCVEEVLDSDNRKIRSEKYHVLCYQQFFDDNYLLSHTLFQLSDDMRVDSNNFPAGMSSLGSASKEAKNKLEK